jgi:uncharacterized phage-associated protein
MNAVLTLAQTFLDLARAEDQDLTGMRLHKLIFLAQIHYHAAGEGRLVIEDAEAWEYGPIYLTLWEQHIRYGSAPFPRTLRFSALPLTGRSKAFVGAFWHHYKAKSAQELSAFVHVPQSPWAQVRAAYEKNERPVISDIQMRAYGQVLRQSAEAKRKKASASALALSESA